MTAGIFTDMHHFGTGISLLMVIGNSYRIKFSRGIIAQQDAGWIFPGNGRAGFNLGPRKFRVFPFANSPFGHKVINTALSLFIAGIPVLNRRIFHFSIFHHHNFHNGCMQLVFITHGCCTTFQIGNVAVLIGHDQCPLKLPGIHSIDTEISGKFHGAANPFGDINEGAVAEYSTVQRGKKVVGIGHHRCHVFLYQIGMMLHRFAEGAENDAHLRQIFTESCFHRNAVHHSIHRHSR